MIVKELLAKLFIVPIMIILVLVAHIMIMVGKKKQDRLRRNEKNIYNLSSERCNKRRN